MFVHVLRILSDLIKYIFFLIVSHNFILVVFIRFYITVRTKKCVTQFFKCYFSAIDWIQMKSIRNYFSKWMLEKEGTLCFLHLESIYEL